ncbi:uncharacterized protein MCYG_06386 [Microsporum canis CBS 113480]|uniref:Uncharacterized protein n=1 Tax=Arthroderma otae (strain ATCC MYA-4605 / CBS 113480) TaxID=554155 RepID=C5FUI3_ARTOC|nr:uncharacterized protein MCYG_06386 [Microsporum canis CBS 113480]EEQ33567.1 predicted protein [Microsporum canis CBS 113480]
MGGSSLVGSRTGSLDALPPPYLHVVPTENEVGLPFAHLDVQKPLVQYVFGAGSSHHWSKRPKSERGKWKKQRADEKGEKETKETNEPDLNGITFKQRLPADDRVLTNSETSESFRDAETFLPHQTTADGVCGRKISIYLNIFEKKKYYIRISRSRGLVTVTI